MNGRMTNKNMLKLSDYKILANQQNQKKSGRNTAQWQINHTQLQTEKNIWKFEEYNP